MKHEQTLTPLSRFDIQATGQYIGYVSGPGELELNIDGEHHYLNVNEVLEVRETFSSFSIRNMTDKTGEVTIKTGMGKLYMSGDGQTVDVLRVRETVKTDVQNASEINGPIVSALGSVLNIRQITETIKTNIQNSSAIHGPIVAALGSVLNIRQITETIKTNVQNSSAIHGPIVAALGSVLNIRQITETIKTNIQNSSAIHGPIVAALGSVLNIRQITETIKTNVQNTVSTQEAAATSLLTSEQNFNAGESFTIAANANRRDITILASEDNVNVVTVAGVPLRAGQYVTFNNYIGSIETQAIELNDKINITEVIK